MQRTGFLPAADVERHLWLVPPHLKEIALEVRNLVSSACPHATERLRRGGLSYHDAAKGGPVKGAVCQVKVERGAVRVSFIHGARLDDPIRLLKGDRLSMRYLVIDSYDEAPWERILDLIQQASSLDPSTFGPLP
jgi:hypothetical protein